MDNHIKLENCVGDEFLWNSEAILEISHIDCNATNDDKLIEIMSRKPTLWNVNDKNYKNRTIRPQIWAEVLAELSLENSEKNIKLVKKKWDSLRTGYMRHKASASTQKSFKYAAQLSFLDAYIRSKSNEKTATDECNADENEEHEAPPMRTQKVPAAQNEHKLQSASGLTAPIESLIVDKYPLTMAENGFCQLLIHEMRQVPVEEQSNVRLQILMFANQKVQEFKMCNDPL